MRRTIFLLNAVCLVLVTSTAGFAQTNRTSRPKQKANNRTSYSIIFDGNSWVAGSGSSSGSNFPNQVKALLQKDGKSVDILNCGVPGLTIDQMTDRVATAIDVHHDKYEILVGLELVNQWGNTDESRGAIYAKYKKYLRDRKAAGFRKVVALTPIAQSHYKRANWEKDRKWFIAKMLAEFPKLGIQVADIGGDPRLSDWQNTTYFTADKIHPTNAGYALIADIIYTTIIDMK